MAKPFSKGRTLRRSCKNVSSFLKESTESATPSKTTMNVVVEIHNEGDKSRRWDNDTELVSEFLDNEEVGQSERSDITKNCSRRASKTLQDRNVTVSKEHFASEDQSRRVELFDLIEDVGTHTTTLKANEINSFPGIEPRRRKQWNTANAMNEGEDSKRPPRKRWSKDTSVIRLPQKSDAFPLIDESRGTASRSSNNLHFDNPAFVSEKEEILRIETDYKRESTKIEIKSINDCSNVENAEEAETGSQCSSKKDGRKTATESHERFVDSDNRSSRARSSGSKEFNSSPSLRKMIDARANSITHEKAATGEKKKEKKLKKSVEETQDRFLRKREPSLLKKRDSHSDEVCSSAKDAKSTDEGTRAKIRRKKKKKRKQGKREREERKAETKYISVTIHGADMLEENYMSTKRPMVKVHIVKARTGDYLRTDNRKEENTFLQPMITSKFDFKENRSMIPIWEEELIFEHDFNAIMKREEDSQVVILFEVIDLLSFAEASYSYDRFGSEGCSNKIAWAFLKPVGTNNTLHTDKKVRLQLYRPKRSFKKYGRHKCEVYTWWQLHNRDKYPSSLFVTVTSVSPPKVEPMLYRQLALNDFPETRSDTRGLSTRTSDSISLPKWARLAAQSCKIPNEKMFETDVSENGCFYVVFSSDGKYLACVHSEEYNYPIIIYEVETGKIHVRFLGHKVFVYFLSWSNDNHHLLSASADQTARVWDVRNQIVQHVEILPHPSYVYCAKYEPGVCNPTVVATGCCDRAVRIWMTDERLRKPELSQELEGHEGFVNSLVFQKNGNLITADNVGAIFVWAVRKNSKTPSNREWCIWKKIKVRDIEGVTINTIVLHPFESRLLVHSRDNSLRMLDLATGVVLQKYNKLNNQRIQSKACISPCGSLILCGGEDSVLNIWNLETGKLLAKYTNERIYRPVTCVDYHPYDHILAFSIFGSPTPVRVLRFNKDAYDNEVGLEIIENELLDRDNDSNINESKSLSNARRKYRATMEKTHHRTNDQTLFSDERTQTTHSNFTVRSVRRTNRLRHIIEKMDKILFIMKLRRTQSATDVDIEANHQDIERNRYVEMNCTIEMEKIKRTGKINFSIANKHLSSPVESSNLTFVDKERYQMLTARRPQSAREFCLSRDMVINQNQFRILSDDTANFARYKRRDSFSQTFVTDTCGNITGKDVTVRPKKQDRSFDSSNSIVSSIDGSDILEKKTLREKSPDSAGTYVIDTTHFKRNKKETNANSSCQFAADYVVNMGDEALDFIEISEISDSPQHSDATFVVTENEIRIPKSNE